MRIYPQKKQTTRIHHVIQILNSTRQRVPQYNYGRRSLGVRFQMENLQ